MPPLAELAAPGAAFGPESYNDWSETALGSLAENLVGKWSLWPVSRRIPGCSGATTWRTTRFRSASELRALAERAQLHVHVAANIGGDRVRLRRERSVLAPT